MSSIPEEIYLQILLRVPVKSTFVCKCVCKTWFSLISDLGFAKMHLDFTPHRNISSNLMVAGLLMYHSVIFSTNYDSLEPSLLEKSEFTQLYYPYASLDRAIILLGSCNGLVCLLLRLRLKELYFFVWNPATGEYKKIKKLTVEINVYDIRMYAFGYDFKNDDYKLVLGVGNNETGTEVHVYTLESDSWKCAVTIPYYFFSDRKSGVLVNGDFHFLAGDRREGMLIVSLNISDERFKEVELFNEFKVTKTWYFATEAVLQGCLCVLLPFRRNSVVADDNYLISHVELWVMQDYGVRESWTKRYIITHELITRENMGTHGYYLWRFVSSSKNGEFLLMVEDKLDLYDLKDGCAISRDMDSTSVSTEVNYIESLVSVNSGTYVREGRIEESIETEEA